MSENNVWNKITGYQDGWEISTSALVVFLVVLMIAVVMLLVNGVYFIKIYDGSTDEELNNYWSRGGALGLAIVNFVIAFFLFVEFIIILRVMITRNSLKDPSCLKALGETDPTTGLPTKYAKEALEKAGLAFASANPSKTGYVNGIAGAGALENGVYIGPEYLMTKADYDKFRDNIKAERDKYVLYDTVLKSDGSDENLNRLTKEANEEYKFSDEIKTQFTQNYSNYIRENPTATPEQIKTALLNTSPPLGSNYGNNTAYNLRRYQDIFSHLPENPYIFDSSKVINPAPQGKTPLYALQRRF